MDMQGWVTLTNNSGTTFANARTLLVAGDPNGGGGGFGRLDGAMDSAGTESNDRDRPGAYYLYPLRQRRTKPNAQQKTVTFHAVKGAPDKRSEGQREGKGGDRRGSTRWAAAHKKKQEQRKQQ